MTRAASNEPPTGPRRRVYMLAPELLDRIHARQISGGHANETETVRFLLTDALARWEERFRTRTPEGGDHG